MDFPNISGDCKMSISSYVYDLVAAKLLQDW